MDGFWGIKTAPINYCEPDYVITEYIAEFWNTLTNIVHFLAGLHGLRLYFKFSLPLPYLIFSLFLSLTAINSAAFHGTLKYIPLKGDEICETIAILGLLYAFTKNYLFLFIHIIIAIGCIIYFVTDFCELHLTFITIIGVLRLIIYWRQLKKSNEFDCDIIEKERMHFMKALIFGAIAGISFAIDKFFCDVLEQYKLPFNIQYLLHAFGWHVFGGLAMYQILSLTADLYVLQFLNRKKDK